MQSFFFFEEFVTSHHTPVEGRENTEPFTLFNRDSPCVHVVVTVLAVLLALRYLSALCLPSFAFKEVPYVFVRPDCPVPAFEDSCLLSMMLRASRNDGAQCAPAAC